jgi:hypothetical protein
MGSSITTITPPNEEQLRMMKAHVLDSWSRYNASFHVYAAQVCSIYPAAALASRDAWERVMGIVIPRPIDAENPIKKERQRLAAIRRHAENAPTDPASLEYWHHLIEGRHLAAGTHQRFSTAEEAIAASHQDQLEAMTQRDAWRVQQETAKAHSLEDPEQQRKALAKVEALDQRLAKEREAAMLRLRNPAPEQAVEEAADV